MLSSVRLEVKKQADGFIKSTEFGKPMLLLREVHIEAKYYLVKTICIIFKIAYQFSAYDYGAQKQPSVDFLIKRCSESIPQIYRRAPMLKCVFTKVEKEIYWNHTTGWVFISMSKFAAYFQNTFFWEHIWNAASGGYYWYIFIVMKNV